MLKKMEKPANNLRIGEKCINCGLQIPITKTFCSKECYRDFHFKIKNKTKAISVARKMYMIEYQMRFEEISISDRFLSN